MQEKTDLKEVYVSIVIEVDGPIPSQYSMRSLGAYAVDVNGEKIGEFEDNICKLASSKEHPDFMKFWKQKNKTWQRINYNPRSPADVMNDFKAWLKNLDAKTVLVAYSSQNVWAFLNYYFTTFTRGSNPFGYGAIDMKSIAMVKLDQEFRKSSRNNFPETWSKNQRPVKSTLDKAYNQAMMFVEMLRADFYEGELTASMDTGVMMSKT